MSKYEQDRENGHTLLLMEIEPEKRTFSDYPNEHICLNTIVNMYEEEKDASGQGEPHDAFGHFMSWLDSFYSIKMLIFDKSISRYRLIEREALKKKFEQNPEHKAETVAANGLSLSESDSESANHWDE